MGERSTVDGPQSTANGISRLTAPFRGPSTVDRGPKVRQLSERVVVMDIRTQIAWLFLLSIPIASISWTVTHEEVFREPREYFVRMSQSGKTIIVRKFFYLFTCEYCFSHYVTALFLFITRYQLLIEDWRGYLIGGFALVWIANIYMSLYAFIRIDIKKERIRAKHEEVKLNDEEKNEG